MHNRFLYQIFVVSLIAFAPVHSEAQNFTDMRRQTESFKRLHPADVRSEVASFTYGGISESAQAPQLIKISPTIISKDSVVIEGNGVYARILLAPLNPKDHKIYYDIDEKTPIRIDRKPYFGDYGKMPLTVVSSVILLINGDTVDIPAKAYQDLMNMKFTYVSGGTERTGDGIFMTKDGKRIYLYLFSNNRSGPYEATLIIQDKQYLRRVLDYDLL